MFLNFKFSKNRAFTIAELLVSISIFVIITSVVLVNFPGFSSQIALDNLAHEVALAVRQAQVFGVSAKESGIGSGIFPTHGVHFENTQDNVFYLFFDLNDNNKYEGISELSETFNIQRRNYISSICGFVTPVSGCTNLATLDITYARPNPEPTILGIVGAEEAFYSYATITVTSPRGSNRVIAVWSNGQIAIK